MTDAVCVCMMGEALDDLDDAVIGTTSRSGSDTAKRMRTRVL